MGPALGTIIAIIITHHIANSSAAERSVHGIGAMSGISAIMSVSMPAPPAR
ncbi:hypothetical protein [Bradyrhizobium sp. CCBAU 53415]|uniref:hypothetical protein n=1 Tax=Bradyrhizobium sp. CCBAU 53415 TaxID=1325119 RepID=UPI002FE3391D